jgi:pilus assembly protein CpaF
VSVATAPGASHTSATTPLDQLEDELHRAVVAGGHDDVAAAARHHALGRAPLLQDGELEDLVRRVVARVQGLGPLDALLADPAVTEVMVNGGQVWIERDGSLHHCDLTLDAATVAHLIERVVAPLGRRVDRSSPIVDARLPSGERVHAIVPPLAIDGPCLTIRRFAATAVPLRAFAAAEVVELLAWAVRSRANVLVTGPTSAGKTTLLNAMAAEVAPGERIITIEDAAELRLPGSHVVRLEARPASADGVGEVTVRDLVRAALRMRPDRLVVGEVRGAEALDMVMAMSTGHDGSLSTCHANGALDALRRVEVMVLQGGGALGITAVRDLVHSAIDLVVHVVRGQGGRRAVTEVVEVRPPGHDEAVRLLATATAVVAWPDRPARSPEAAHAAEASR